MSTTNSQIIAIEPIGIIHSCYKEKFGIPRQPGLVKTATASIEIYEPFNRIELFKGLDSFSHIWVHFIFHQTINKGWKTTVRPPRLGGQKRVGVFATRSPHRPNHLGLSVVKLEKITKKDNGIFLELSGIDFLDQTPVIDIKPYVAFTDNIPNTKAGYTIQNWSPVNVLFTKTVELFCNEYQQNTGLDLYKLVHDTLSQDPRPASQRNKEREFGMKLWDVNIRWKFADKEFLVFSAEMVDLDQQ